MIGNGALNVELESFASNSGFIGEMQNVRVYRRALEHNDVLDDMRWPFTPRALSKCSCKVVNREKSVKQLVILFGFVGKL